MKNIQNKTLVIITALSAGVTFAGDFPNQEFSVSDFSPAQRHKRSAGTSAQVLSSQDNKTLTDKASSSETELKSSIESIEVLGQYNALDYIYSGLSLKLEQAESTVTQSASETESTRKDYSLNPFVGIKLNKNMTAAYELAYQKQETDGESDDFIGQHVLGFIYHNEAIEVGTAYRNKVDREGYKIPGNVIIHGQTIISDGFWLGAAIKQNFNNQVNDSLNDSTELKIYSHYKYSHKWDFDGAVAYQPSALKSDSISIGEDASQIEFQAGAYYSPQENIQVGAGVGMTQTEDSNDLSDVDGTSTEMKVMMKVSL